jgi:hypothetical protein
MGRSERASRKESPRCADPPLCLQRPSFVKAVRYSIVAAHGWCLPDCCAAAGELRRQQYPGSGHHGDRAVGDGGGSARSRRGRHAGRARPGLAGRCGKRPPLGRRSAQPHSGRAGPAPAHRRLCANLSGQWGSGPFGLRRPGFDRRHMDRRRHGRSRPVPRRVSGPSAPRPMPRSPPTLHAGAMHSSACARSMAATPSRRRRRARPWRPCLMPTERRSARPAVTSRPAPSSVCRTGIWRPSCSPRLQAGNPVAPACWWLMPRRTDSPGGRSARMAAIHLRVQRRVGYA